MKNKNAATLTFCFSSCYSYPMLRDLTRLFIMASAIQPKTLALLSICFTILFSIYSCSYEINRAEKKKLQGKTFVIIGASSGFGQGVALELGKHRANVVIAARRTDLLEEIASKIRFAG